MPCFRATVMASATLIYGVALFVVLAVLFFFLAPRLTDAGKRKRGPSGGDYASKRKKR